jgi:hypothetical protein
LHKVAVIKSGINVIKKETSEKEKREYYRHVMSGIR